MSDHRPRRRWTPPVGWLIPVVLTLGAAAFATVVYGTSDDDSVDPLAVRADGPSFETIEQLVDASDLVVEATVVAVDDGRAISDPVDPDAGIRTSLARLAVTDVFKGTGGDVMIVEQEASLLDGTPIIVNGLTPNEVGHTGFWFLVGGPSDEFPYVALVNEQARVLRFGNDLTGSELVAGLTLEDFRELVAE